MPNSGDSEKLAPEHDTTVVGNVVYDNSNGKTPAIDDAKLAQGNGILVAGGNTNLVTNNLVYNHDIAGIAIVPNPDTTVWIANGNKVLNNVVRGSDEGDLAAFGGDGNCFAGNKFETSKPSNIEQVLPCTGTGVPATDQLDLQKYLDASKPPSVDYRKAKTPSPPRLAGMKNPAKAAARPAVRIVVKVDVDCDHHPEERGTASRRGSRAVTRWLPGLRAVAERTPTPRGQIQRDRHRRTCCRRGAGSDQTSFT